MRLYRRMGRDKRLKHSLSSGYHDWNATRSRGSAAREELFPARGCDLS